MKKVCLKTANWTFVLMLIISGSVLNADDPPSIQNQAILAGKPVATTPVPPALREALANALGAQAAAGAKAIPTPPAGSWGIVSEGDGGGGIFRDSDSEAEAWLGTNGYGVEGFGSVMGGYFKDSDGTSYAQVGSGSWGIRGYGTSGGGYFQDTNGTGYANVGYGNIGILASGSSAGGYFQGTDGYGYAYVGYGTVGISALGLDKGIEAQGYEMGGYFKDFDGTGFARAGYGNRGIEAYGSEMGGYFKDSDQSGYAYVGHGNRGISAWGSEMGGQFWDSGGTSWANVAYGHRGIEAFGPDMGGYFEDSDDSGWAYVGHGNTGVHAEGNVGIYGKGTEMGAEFSFVDPDDPSIFTWAHLADGNYGINTYAETVGGYFLSAETASHAYVGWSTYKIAGSGAMAFVQNHPDDPSSVIVYAAPEGDEVATYTRGTARLVDSEVTVPLGETFKWVTNPDIGLTAFLTPVGEWCDLIVAEQATDSIVVRSRDGSDCAFNFMVYGLRIGFEESSIVQEKTQESYIPSMADHRQLYDRRPDLKSYNSLERFRSMNRAAGQKDELDLSRAQALRDAVIEFDPAVHQLPEPPDSREMIREDATSEIEGHREGTPGRERVRATRADHDRLLASDRSGLSADIPVDDDGDVYATSFPPSSGDLASLVAVSEPVEAGDVLVIDRGSAGMMRKGAEGHDSGVIGVVAAHAGVVLGSQPPFSRISETIEGDTEGAPQQQAAVALAGVVICKVDTGYGAIWPGDLLVTSPTPGHAMRTDAPLPGTVVGKALEPLQEGVGTIKVLVMLR